MKPGRFSVHKPITSATHTNVVKGNIGPIHQPTIAHTFTDPLSKASFSTASPQPAYKLPDMPYAYNALEPIISGEIMELHHKKHHQAYVNNLNAALEKYAAAENKKDIDAMIALQPAIKFNGGGHVNHSILWKNLISPKQGGGELGSGDLANRITKQWGSLEQFQTIFNTAAAGVQGSGWGWLGYSKAEDRLVIATCPNQDPLSHQFPGVTPLLGVDVWEHAYYLQYKNVRPDYLKAIWKVVNWSDVSSRLEAVTKA